MFEIISSDSAEYGAGKILRILLQKDSFVVQV